jgi:DNA polymerase-3 subunit alpha
MSKSFNFSCGCKFSIIGGSDEHPLIHFDPVNTHLNLDCIKTWELISDGNTKGCFQLESRLGRSMAKKLKPQNIEQLSALISILRPGCLEAVREGKTVSSHYIDRKNGLESIDYYHPALENILKTTYGEMIYQEQAMEIAKHIAGFDLQEADSLRKAIGKKKPEEMAKLKQKFIQGSVNIGLVNQNQAEEIFGWIEKSQRYSFNKSHAVSYAINAYLSAYTKAHFPKIFFASYLRFAKDKIDPKAEIKELVQNANEMDISVCIPDIRNLNKFFLLKNQSIYFGLTDIRGFGESVYNKLINIIKDKQIDINTISWLHMLCHILLDINSIAAKALIKSGALSFYKKTRTQMLYEYNIANELTKKEIGYVLDYINGGGQVLELGILHIIKNCKVTAKRKIALNSLIQNLSSPAYSMDDSPEWLSDSEEETLGCSITCSKVDMYDITMTNSNCKDFKTSINKNNIILCGEIESIGITKTKTGKSPGSEMAFVSVSDSYGMLDSVIFFPEVYKKYRNILFDHNVIIIQGKKNQTGDSLIVEKAYLPKT